MMTLMPSAPRCMVRLTACFMARRKDTRPDSWSAMVRATKWASISGWRISWMFTRTRRPLSPSSWLRSSSTF